MPNKYLKNPKEFHEIIKMLFYLADHIAAYKMSNADRTKAEKERRVYESNQSKDERKKEQSVRLINLRLFFVNAFLFRKFNVNFRKRKIPVLPPKRKLTKRMIPRRRCKKKLLKPISLL